MECLQTSCLAKCTFTINMVLLYYSRSQLCICLFLTKLSKKDGVQEVSPYLTELAAKTTVSLKTKLIDLEDPQCFNGIR